MARVRWQSFVLAAVVVLAAVFGGPGTAQAQIPPSFSKTFEPSTIGVGSVSTLRFDINNVEPSPATELAFTDTLPAGVTIASPANASTTCGGVLTALDGGGNITFTDGVVSGSSQCTVSVDVTSGTVATHTNVSGDLTSSAGNSGPATDDLTVAADRPGFSKSFSPASIAFGARSTLTFTIDNTANASTAYFLTFTDLLPSGMVVADPSLASTTCSGGEITAAPGTGSISYGPAVGGDASVAAGATCTASVDVLAMAVGSVVNVSGELTSFNVSTTVSSGFASATLEVTAGTVLAVKSFTDDPVIPGDTVTLEFTVTNNDRTLAATNIAFTDDLDATLPGLVATGLPAIDVCGPGSQITGTSLLSLTGGSLPPEGSCTFSVTLQVPAAAAAGVYPNVTSAVSADLGGSPVEGDQASDVLVVNLAPRLTKSFLTDPVGSGEPAVIEFTVTNTSATSAATDIAFQDNIGAFLPGTLVTGLPSAGFCGAGSSMTTLVILDEIHLIMTGGDLPAGGSCTFQVDLLIPPGGAGGTFINTTEPISATVDGVTQLGEPASDSLTVVSAPRLSKEFTDDPAVPGGTTTLEFTISHDALAPADATAIAFSDDLAATLSGLTAIGLPLDDVCGTGSQISGTANLALTGGTLAPGASCTFSVTLQVPAAALPGVYTNVTSDLGATVAGVPAVSGPASDDLQIAGLSLTKSFTDDPVLPGGTVTLEFTIDNTSTALDATGMFFTDNLSSALSGLVATGLPNADVCGAGSQISGTDLLIFTGGSLAAGASCTFSITLDVPAAAASDTYNNTTSDLVADVGGTPVVLPPATDDLVVNADLLQLSKTFTDDPVAPGDPVTLEFTVTNLDPAQAAAGITFTDDLDAALSGLVAVGLPANDVCGAGSQISGTGLLTLTGAGLPPGGTCTFNVTLQVPPDVPLGTTATNTTSQVTGTVGGLPVSGGAASDDLRIDFMEFSKAFDAPVGAGGTAVLTFVIENLDATNSVDGISFSDDLDAVLSGLAAVGLPVSDVCGAGSQIAGTSLLTLTGGSLSPGGSCTINVTVQVPVAASPGVYVNTTSDLLVSGLPAASPASATLTVEGAPLFSKAFSPGLIRTDGVSTLTFTIDNGAATVAASGLDFTDNLPAGIVVATPPNGATTCSGGTLTAVAGSAVVSYTGGTVPAASTCTVSVDVVGSVAGTLVNTSGDLTSSLGNSGPATATLTVVEGSFALAKTFLSGPVLRGGSVDLEFTLTNVSSVTALTDIAFTDDLDAVVPGLAAIGLPVADVCGAGSQLSGDSVVALIGGSLAPGASCVFTATVVVPADAPLGTFTNATSTVTASAGGIPVSAPAASADLQTAFLAFDKTFLDAAVPGGTVALEFSISNPDPANAATGIGFTDDLDAVVPGLVAIGLPAADVCGTGSLLDGTSVLTLTGGSLGPAESCVFSVTLRVPASAPGGSYANTTSILDATVGGSPVAGDAGSEASDVLDVGAAPAIPMLDPRALLLLAALTALVGIWMLRVRT
jgi:hypothetical protein